MEILYTDDIDIDDDNDGILDTDEVCGNPGGVPGEADAIIWEDESAAFQIYAIGGNTTGFGYRESGFEQEALARGFNLTYPTNNDFTIIDEAAAANGTATTTTGTFANGDLSYESNAAEFDGDGQTRQIQIRRTTANGIQSGNGGDAIHVKPPVRLVNSEWYKVVIDFNTPVTAFSFDLIDILDSNVITTAEE